MTDEYAAADLGEIGHEDLAAHAGHVGDRDLSKTLSLLEDLEPDLPEIADAARRSHLTQRVTDAIDQGHSPLLAYLTGWTDRDVPVDMAEAVQYVSEAVASDAYTATFSGHMNSGKTNAALWFLDRWVDVWTARTNDDRHDGRYVLHVATNAETVIDGIEDTYPDVHCHLVQSFDKLKEWSNADLAQFAPEGVEVKRCLLADEMSTHLDAHTHQEQAIAFKKWLLKMAKFGGIALLIGHTGIDIHKEIRRLVLSAAHCEAIHKPEKKKAGIFDGIDDDLPPVGERFTLDRLPLSRVDYDPDDFSPWEW